MLSLANNVGFFLSLDAAAQPPQLQVHTLPSDDDGFGRPSTLATQPQQSYYSSELYAEPSSVQTMVSTTFMAQDEVSGSSGSSFDPNF